MSDTSSAPSGFTIRDLTDKVEFSALIAKNWGGDVLLMRGRPYASEVLTGTAAFDEKNTLAGLIAWNIEAATCNIMAINAFFKGQNIGKLLLDHVIGQAIEAGMRSVRIMTTNDNVEALRFYQIYGFRLSSIMVGAIDAYRVIKPTLPEIGRHGIPMRDTIELEIML